MSELILLVGNIGSGKSTYAKQYRDKGYILIARDRLRYAIGGGKYIFNREYEPVIWKTELYLYRKFVDLGENIVVDKVGISEKRRRRYISYAKKKDYKVICVEMPRLDMKTCVNRRMKDPHGQYNRKLWEKIWKGFDSIYEIPNLDEGFDEIRRLK